jgi:hypothetical protein
LSSISRRPKLSVSLFRRACSRSRTRWSNETDDVCFWHLADIPTAFRDVRFWEQSGHWDRQQECPLLTQSAHLQPHFLSNCHDGGWGMSNQQQQSLSFGVIDRPECPYCGERAYLTRRSPHPDHDLRYELQVFTCSACDHTIERIVDANGNPPAELKCCD